MHAWAQTRTLGGDYGRIRSGTLSISYAIAHRTAIQQEFNMLYPADFGVPLMENGAKSATPARRVTPINEHSAKGTSHYDVYGGPKPGSSEQVYFLRLWADSKA